MQTGRTSPGPCEMKKKFPMNRKVKLAFGSAIFALLIVGGISYRGMVVSGESDQWVRHTHMALENIQDMLAAMRGVDSSYGGFALTGDESFVATYRADLVLVERFKENVRHLTVDNPVQQRQITILNALT